MSPVPGSNRKPSLGQLPLPEALLHGLLSHGIHHHWHRSPRGRAVTAPVERHRAKPLLQSLCLVDDGTQVCGALARRHGERYGGAPFDILVGLGDQAGLVRLLIQLGRALFAPTLDAGFLLAFGPMVEAGVRGRRGVPSEWGA